MWVKFFRWLKELGMGPFRALDATERKVRLERRLRDFGKRPLKEFTERSRWSKWRQLPRVAGMWPWKAFSEIVSCCRAVRLPMAGESGPV